MARVLIVEDDRQIRYLYEQALQFQGIEVGTASTSEEALEDLHTKGADLILLDLLLPGSSGIDFLRELRKNVEKGYDLPIVIVSHLQDDSVKQQAMIMGATAYLSKTDHSIGDIIREVRKLVPLDAKE